MVLRYYYSMICSPFMHKSYMETLIDAAILIAVEKLDHLTVGTGYVRSYHDVNIKLGRLATVE